ncbi:heptaprenyl diphosphate synthase component 1 [Niallia sp. 03133]|uniref:heptaprenyl diphosphate synthase component 1 n=1 Tax=Niallia sp. 03133 TaxID=3458060 RepID=UPI004043AEAB
MANIQELMDEVKEKITKKIDIPYLFQHIPEPNMDEDKLLLTVAALKASKLSEKEAEIYTMTTMLIQIALDTHELVTNESISKGIEKSRQLTVLAGDYYSGHYYKLLADVDDISMIKKLAEAIKEINEHKIYLYHETEKDINQLLKSVEIVEFSLLDKLLTHFQMEEWKAICRTLLVLKRLLKEKTLYLQTGTSILMTIMPLDKSAEKDIQHSNRLLILEKYLLSACSQLEKAAELLPAFNDSLLHNRIENILNECKQLQLYVEEG